MTLPVVLRSEALLDVQSARDWYEGQRMGLGEDFIATVDDTLAQISKAPELYAVVLRDVRRVKLRRFSYVAYYRVFSDRIEVLGVLHGRRNPQIWRDRV